MKFLKHRVARWSALALVLWVQPAAAAEPPVVFIHGFCSAAETWAETLPQLLTRRYGNDAPRLYESAIGKAGLRTTVSHGSKMFRIDFSDSQGRVRAIAVANVPTARKAGELKVVIDAIKRFTGAPRVILVAHSLGGLAARAYVQGIARDRNGAIIAYGRDVAALIMISTPNQGQRPRQPVGQSRSATPARWQTPRICATCSPRRAFLAS